MITKDILSVLGDNISPPVEIKTITGMTWDRAIEKLNEVLDPAAYTKIFGSSADLTDISPAYMIEYFTKVFGPIGVGWHYEYQPEDIHVVTDPAAKAMFRYNAQIVRLDFWVLLIVNGSPYKSHIYSAGSSNNTNWDYAVNGALTSAISKCASKLLWQQSVYKGNLSHVTATEEYQKQEAEKVVSENAVDDEAQIMSTDQVAAVVKAAKDAGYDLSLKRVRDAFMKALSLEPKVLNEIPRREGRIMYGYCSLQKGKPEEEKQSAKELGKQVAAIAAKDSLSWEDARRAYEKSITEESEKLGGKIGGKKE